MIADFLLATNETSHTTGRLLGIRIAWLFGGTFIFFIGVFGNVISLMVYFCGHYFVRNFSAFLLAHIFSNLAVMICLAEITFDIATDGQEEMYSLAQFKVRCRLFNWANGWATTFNSWLLVALTLIRLVSTIRPTYRMMPDKLTVNLSILICMCVSSALLQSPRIILDRERIEHGKLICEHASEVIMVWIDLLLQCALPGAILIISNIRIGRTLYASTQRLRMYRLKSKLPSSTGSVTISKPTEPSVECPTLGTEAHKTSGGSSVDLLKWAPMGTSASSHKRVSLSVAADSLEIPRSPTATESKEPQLEVAERERITTSETRIGLKRTVSVAAAKFEELKPLDRLRSVSTLVSKNVFNYSTALLLFLSFSFVICNTPLFTYRAVKNSKHDNQNLELIFSLLFYFGHSITIYTYTFTGTRFRRACKGMLYEAAARCIIVFPSTCCVYLKSKALEVHYTISSSITKLSPSVTRRF